MMVRLSIIHIGSLRAIQGAVMEDTSSVEAEAMDILSAARHCNS